MSVFCCNTRAFMICIGRVEFVVVASSHLRLGRERLHLLNHPTIATDVDGESAGFYAGKMLER